MMLNDLHQTGFEFSMIGHTKQVVAQMVAKRTVIIRGIFAQFVKGGTLAGNKVKCPAIQVGVTAKQLGKLCRLFRVQRITMTLVKFGNLLFSEIA